MNLWESVYAFRHHGEVPPVTPPGPPAWAPTEDLLTNSRAIDLAPVADPDLAGDEPTDDTADEREYGDGQREHAREEIRRRGFEAIAFYASIHSYGADHCGIYFNERVFFGACADLAAELPAAPWDSIVKDMLVSLDYHEAFHAAVELFALVVEDFAFLRELDLESWRGENVQDLPEGAMRPDWKCPYDLYVRSDYVPSLATDDCLEEALATAIQLRAPMRTKGIRKALAKMADSAPAPYRAWRAHVKDIDFGVQSLAQRILSRSFRTSPVADVLLGSAIAQSQMRWFPDSRPSRLDTYGPIPRWIYRPDRVRPPRFGRAILGNIRLQEFLNGLQRSYDARLVSGGKHPAIVFPNGTKIPFPRQRTVPTYLINQVARALNVTRKEILSNCLAVRV